MIPQKIIDDIAASLTLSEVISRYITLTKKGSGYWGICPFHDDKNASLSVSNTKGIWKCFACDTSGNLFSFIQKHEQVSFPVAVKMLGKIAGIEVPDRELSEEERVMLSRKEGQYIALGAINEHYANGLSSPVAQEYLRSRGVDVNNSVFRSFSPGYVDGKGIHRELSLSPGTLLDVGFLSSGERGTYELLRERITFPFYDFSGNIVGFTGRYIGSNSEVKNKYQNSPDTELYHKGKLLFGLHQAKAAIAKFDMVYLVEGQFDVISMHLAGVPNTVGGSGTALTDHHIKLLLRLTKNITLMYDGDDAGRRATVKHIESLVAAGAQVRVVPLKEKEDPDEFARSHGDNTLKMIEKRKCNFVQFLANEGYVEDEYKRRAAFENICRIMAPAWSARDKISLSDSIAKLAKKFGVATSDVYAHLRTIKRKDKSANEESTSGFYGLDELSEYSKSELESIEITSDLEEFSSQYGETPIIYATGVPTATQVQTLRSHVKTLLYSVPEDVAPNELDISEPSYLLMLKELHRAGVTVNIFTPESGAEKLQFVSFYLRLYSRFLPNTSESDRATCIERCIEMISITSPSVQAVNEQEWQNRLGLGATQYKRILTPFLDKRKNKAEAHRMTGFEDSFYQLEPDRLPEYVTNDPDRNAVYNRFGFYPLLSKRGEAVSYMFKNTSGAGHTMVGDFFMTPLLHIKDPDPERNKRVMMIRRVRYEEPIYLEVKSSQLATLQSFKLMLLNEEALNFENGTNAFYEKILQQMSYNYITCKELTTYGQQPEGFYAFANSIYHRVGDEYRIEHIDEKGVVTHDGRNYYLPAFSKMYSSIGADNDKYEQVRHLIYQEVPTARRCDFSTWSALMNEVYKANDNGKFAIIYAIMSAFRSNIHEVGRLFTAIFLVGEKSGGKSVLAQSIRALFVKPNVPAFNLTLSSDAAFSTILESVRDVIVVMEEYNNKISETKLQGLKDATYNGDGKTKRKSAGSKDLDVSKIFAALVILGQETSERDDNSLTTRVVLREVPKKSFYTDVEKEAFDRLKAFENAGLSHLLCEVLKHRGLFASKFREEHYAISRALTMEMLSGGESLPDLNRVLNAYCLFLTTCKLIEEHTPDLPLPFTYAEFLDIVKRSIRWQINIIAKSDKLSGFFKAVDAMTSTRAIVYGRDYTIQSITRTKIVNEQGDTIDYVPQQPTKLLFLRLSSIFIQYQRYSHSGEEKTNETTLLQNLRSNPAYLGTMKQKKFVWFDREEVPYGGVLSDGMVNDTMRVVMRRREKNTSCVVLNYEVFRDHFDIDLETYGLEEEGSHESDSEFSAPSDPANTSSNDGGENSAWSNQIQDSIFEPDNPPPRRGVPF